MFEFIYLYISKILLLVFYDIFLATYFRFNFASTYIVLIICMYNVHTKILLFVFVIFLAASIFVKLRCTDFNSFTFYSTFDKIWSFIYYVRVVWGLFLTMYLPFHKGRT